MMPATVPPPEPGEHPSRLSLIQRIISACAHYPLMTLLAVMTLCILAYFTLHEIRLDALPDFPLRLIL